MELVHAVKALQSDQNPRVTEDLVPVGSCQGMLLREIRSTSTMPQGFSLFNPSETARYPRRPSSATLILFRIPQRHTMRKVPPFSHWQAGILIIKGHRITFRRCQRRCPACRPTTWSQANQKYISKRMECSTNLATMSHTLPLGLWGYRNHSRTRIPTFM